MEAFQANGIPYFRTYNRLVITFFARKWLRVGFYISMQNVQVICICGVYAQKYGNIVALVKIYALHAIYNVMKLWLHISVSY